MMNVKKGLVLVILMVVFGGFFVFADDVKATENLVKSEGKEPQIISVSPNPKEDGLVKDSLFSNRAIVIYFSENISEVDFDKISVDTLNGTKASLFNFGVGEDSISFQIYGDSTTRAVINIEPGFVSNMNGVCNTWSYTYEIDYMYEVVGEKQAKDVLLYDSTTWVYDVYYDQKNETVYAIVMDYDYALYWVKVDENNKLTQVKIDEIQGANLSKIIPLDDDTFLFSFEPFNTVGSAREFRVIDKDGRILSKYGVEYDRSYAWYFTNAMGLADGSIYYLSSVDGVEKLYKIGVDNEYQITTALVKDNFMTCSSGIYTNQWLTTDDSIWAIEFVEDENDSTKQKMYLWRIQDEELEKKEYVLENEYSYSFFMFDDNNAIIEDEDSYIIFIDAGYGIDDSYNMNHTYALRLSKDDLSIIDYKLVFEEEGYENIGGFAVQNIWEINADEYIVLATSTIPVNPTLFFGNMDVNFYICVDKCFNVKWVQIAQDSNRNCLVVKDSGEMYVFSKVKGDPYSVGYFEIEPQNKEVNDFEIKNNLSTEVEKYRIVKGGQLRYCIPHKDGYGYAVYINGKLTEVSDGILNYDTSLTELSNNTIEIKYSNANGLSKSDDGKLYYYKNGWIDISFSGMICDQNNNEWLVEKGVVTGTYTGLYKVNGAWCYIKDSKKIYNYTGMAQNEYGWWYVKDGKIDITYTGLATNDFGTWYMKNGKIDTTVNGLVKISGRWQYFSKGKLNAKYTGVATNDYGTWYMENGRIDTTFTGLYKYNGKWQYFAKGKLNATYTGAATNDYGTWYMENGSIDTTFTGLYKYSGKWQYFAKGKLNATYTGVATNAYGTWYMENGRIDTTFTGLYKYNGKWQYFANGKLNSTYTGLAKNTYGTWYMKNGKIASSYSGKVTLGGKTYTIKNGKVV